MSLLTYTAALLFHIAATQIHALVSWNQVFAIPTQRTTLTGIQPVICSIHELLAGNSISMWQFETN